MPLNSTESAGKFNADSSPFPAPEFDEDYAAQIRSLNKVEGVAVVAVLVLLAVLIGLVVVF